jgi:demethylmenaquinone methyltransferase / 2-methoxy-6-polyprenyl-1,4-benzoquinol methylase
MFDRIAPVYDAMNTVMTAGIDARWRRATLHALALQPGERAVDVATGTGKLALAAAAEVAPGGRVVGLDASAAMLAQARRAEAGARGAAGGPVVEWVIGNAMAMPFGDGEFDAAVVGFGLRNMPDLDAALGEMARVLRPGGRLAVLEIAEPPTDPGRLLFRTWFRGVVPLLGRLVGQAAAYAYLPESLARYPRPDDVARRMAAAGFEAVRWRWLPSGLATLHVGRRT